MQLRSAWPSGPGISGMTLPQGGVAISLSSRNPVAGFEPVSRYGFVLLAQTGFNVALDGFPTTRAAAPAVGTSSPARPPVLPWQPACVHFATIKAAPSQTMGPPVP